MASSKLFIKICGMRDPENILDVGGLSPDFMGFIFFEGSKRNAEGLLNPVQLQHLDSGIRKTGVFVDADMDTIGAKVRQYFLGAVQLHGCEDAAFCEAIKKSFSGLVVIKAFGISRDFEFDAIKPYESSCDYFLFDTKCAGHGGSGERFDWGLLQKYSGDIPFFLSGGIDRDNIGAAGAAVKAHAMGIGLDLNSGFEISPGVKAISLLRDALNRIEGI